MKLTKNLTPFAQYYMKHNDRFLYALEEAKWVIENQELFKGLIPGEIYICFENEEPALNKTAGKPKYKSIYKKDRSGRKRHTTKRVSENGNFLYMKIGICKNCGSFKASKKLKKAICNECITKERNEKMRLRHYQTSDKKKKRIERFKKSKEKKKTAFDIAFDITGYYPRVSECHMEKLIYPDVFDDIEAVMA